jgi:hypothetical protein
LWVDLKFNLKIKMKKTFLLAIVFFSLLIISCKKDIDVDTLTTNADLLTIKPIGGYQSLNVNSNVKWSAKSLDTWCTLSDTIGTGNKSLVVQCEDNISGINRETKILMTAGTQSKTMIVKQSGGTVLLDENFNDNIKNWSIIQNDTLSQTLVNGYYNVKNNCKSSPRFVGTKSLISNYSGNYMISFRYKYISGTSPFGLTFANKDKENFYRILAYPQGAYMISKRVANITTTLKSSPSLLFTNDNTIVLIKIGNFCDVYVNESKIDTFDLSTPFGSYVGFYSYPLTEVNIDCIKIVQF